MGVVHRHVRRLSVIGSVDVQLGSYCCYEVVDKMSIFYPSCDMRSFLKLSRPPMRNFLVDQSTIVERSNWSKTQLGARNLVGLIVRDDAR